MAAVASILTWSVCVGRWWVGGNSLACALGGVSATDGSAAAQANEKRASGSGARQPPPAHQTRASQPVRSHPLREYLRYICARRRVVVGIFHVLENSNPSGASFVVL